MCLRNWILNRFVILWETTSALYFSACSAIHSIRNLRQESFEIFCHIWSCSSSSSGLILLMVDILHWQLQYSLSLSLWMICNYCHLWPIQCFVLIADLNSVCWSQKFNYFICILNYKISCLGIRLISLFLNNFSLNFSFFLWKKETSLFSLLIPPSSTLNPHLTLLGLH